MENKELETKEELTDTHVFTEIKEPFTLKVRGGDANKKTDVNGLSRSILHVLEENPDGYCKVLSVGPIALSISMAAFRLAASELSYRTKGVVLVATQSEYTAFIADTKTRGICTRIFPIPVSYQL